MTASEWLYNKNNMPPKPVKVGKYKTVFRGEVFDIRQAGVVLPSGKKMVFEQAVRPANVVILPIDAKGRLLLVREWRRRYNRYLWGLPGGRVDKEKSVINAAQRELREETGFRAAKLKLFHKGYQGLSMDWKRYAYIATGLTPAPLLGDEDEDITVVPVSIERAFKMVAEDKFVNEFMAFLVTKLYFHRKKI